MIIKIAKTEESLGLMQRTGDRWGPSGPLYGLSLPASVQGDYATARLRIEEALANRWEARDCWSVAQALSRLGIIASEQGDGRRAREHYTESSPRFGTWTIGKALPAVWKAWAG
jgi:hypothetical protein